MLFKFFPREIDFFELFNQQAEHAVDVAKQFKVAVEKGNFTEELLQNICTAEHQCDKVTQTIIEQLNKTFITPFDREDIHALALEIDNIVDMMTTLTNRLIVYKIKKTNKDLMEFASVIRESTRAVATAVKGLNDLKNVALVNNACREVNSLENLGDTVRDRVLTELFENEKNPIEVIKWKDIYTDAETVLDICEDVAHVIGNILVKQA